MVYSILKSYELLSQRTYLIAPISSLWLFKIVIAKCKSWKKQQTYILFMQQMPPNHILYEIGFYNSNSKS